MPRYNIIYKDQTAVRLILDTSLDLDAEGLASSKIAYKKPDGTAGDWTGTILNSPGTDGKIYVDFNDTIKFTDLGDWVIWAELIFSDARVGYGKPKFYNVKEKGSVPN